MGSSEDDGGTAAGVMRSFIWFVNKFFVSFGGLMRLIYETRLRGARHMEHGAVTCCMSWTVD